MSFKSSFRISKKLQKFALCRRLTIKKSINNLPTFSFNPVKTWRKRCSVKNVSLQLYEKRDYGTSVFLIIVRNF